MPTYLRLPRFNRDWEQLSKQEQARFRAALVVFVADLAAGTGFRPGLRVKKLAGHDIWEMTWAPDGRATFSYGPPVKDGEVHIIWRRVGSQQIFTIRSGTSSARPAPGDVLVMTHGTARVGE